MKILSSFFEGVFLWLINKISDIDLFLNYIPYEKFIGILADETGMALEDRISETFKITPETYYQELAMIVCGGELVPFYKKGISGKLEVVKRYRREFFYGHMKSWHVKRGLFLKMIESQKALYEENLKVIERMTALETDEEIVKNFIRYWKDCEPYCFSTGGKKEYLGKIAEEFYKTFSSFSLENYSVLIEYVNLKERMENISEKLFLNFTQLH